MDAFELSAAIKLNANEFNSGLKNAESKFQAFGKKLASAAGKAVAVASAAIATGTVMIGKQSVAAYAEYEQLVGGVETLFKDSAKTVQKYAETAFKDAGVSANKYMEISTSFAASLISGLGGDTKQAAEMANTAIVDMSDNANKMGTDLSAIQNAYQGFAKQNYTMLDNLKLGRTHHCRAA
jgi:phage-related protein